MTKWVEGLEQPWVTSVQPRALGQLVGTTGMVETWIEK